MRNNSYIAFIGDSYCSAYDNKRWQNFGRHPHQTGHTSSTHPSLVADHYGYELLAHGYAGQSWWYSRAEFLKQIKQQPEILDRLEAMIFFHTNADRINSVNKWIATKNVMPGFKDYIDENHRQVAQAQQQWFKHLMDEEFQTWAQNSWFKEITADYSHIKQVHFHCFRFFTPYNHLLTGQKFSTPLIKISVGELIGPRAQGHQSMINDQRANHMSEHNNCVLAETIINALDNYSNNTQELDLTKFNLVNPNYNNYPDGQWWTE